MTTFRLFVPYVMGALMGLMMLRMAHGAMTGQSPTAATALIVFIAMHLVVIAVGALLIVWASKYAPTLRKKLERLHRPSLRHVGQMLAAALLAATATHLFLHGGL